MRAAASGVNIYAEQLHRYSEATEYLLKRRVQLSVAARFGVGYCGDNQFNNYYRRLTFPIHKLDGTLVAYQARALFDYKAENVPKYWHAPFDKGKTLYGLFDVYADVVRCGYIVLTEGPFEVLACAANNIPAVALLGTACTAYQIGLIARYTDKVVLALDADPPGIQAQDAICKLAQAGGLNVVHFPTYAGAKDLAEAHENGVNLWNLISAVL